MGGGGTARVLEGPSASRLRAQGQISFIDGLLASHCSYHFSELRESGVPYRSPSSTAVYLLGRTKARR